MNHTDGQKNATSKFCDKLLKVKIKTAVKIYVYMYEYKPTYLVNKIDKLKQPRGLTQDSGQARVCELHAIHDKILL